MKTAPEWTSEAAEAISLCKSWAAEVTAEIPSEIYLFGSAIYELGEQFDSQNSDLDLVVLFQENLDATGRAKRLEALKVHKVNLELTMIPRLHRTNCEDAGVSILPVTGFEVQTNIHKSGARRFFDKNVFLHLSSEHQAIGMQNAGTSSASEEARQALEYIQKIRNQYLSVSANGTGGLPSFDGYDPLPKSLSRVAAQLVPDAVAGAWYDTRHGLEYLWDDITRRRTQSVELQTLHRTISIRRGGRGIRKPLSAQDQLLLVELLYDRAAALPVESTVTWEIHFAGNTVSLRSSEKLKRDLLALIPDVEIIKVTEGSVIFRIRSSKRSYETLKKLQGMNILEKWFDVESVSLSTDRTGFGSDSAKDVFRPQGVIEQIAVYISNWRPKSTQTEAEAEMSLASWLEELGRVDTLLTGGTFYREAVIGDGRRQLQIDFAAHIPSDDNPIRFGIELVRIRTRNGFFRELDRLRGLWLPIILVVTGTHEQLSDLSPDFQMLSEIESGILVVPVQLDNG